MARARGGETGAAASMLKFMYVPPPSIVGSCTSNDSSNRIHLTQRQPGDDDAAAAFREMLAAAAGAVESNLDGESSEEYSLPFSNSRGAALQGSTVESNKKKEHMSALEKAVGKKTLQGLTLEEQIERFPQLKNAPMAKGMTETNVHVTFKPLGTQLRNVRCLACGVWGHSRNDRECLVSGWDPFSGGAPSMPSTLTPQPRNQTLETVPNASSKEEETSHRERGNRKQSRKHTKRRHCSDSSTSNSSDDSSVSSSNDRRSQKRKENRTKRRHHESHRRRRHREQSPHAHDEDNEKRHKRRRKYDSKDD